MRARTSATDVVVVGAGLAGLSAAAALQSSGRSVRVVEARDEVGGRVRTRVVDGEIVDLGAEFVGRSHRRVRELAERVGIQLEPARFGRQRVIWTVGGNRRTGRVPRLSPRELASLARAAAEVRRLARGLDPDRPWRSPSSGELDSRSVGEWLSGAGICGRASVFTRALIEGFATVPLESLSLLHLLWWIRRGGIAGATRWRVGGGAQRLADGLAEQLREPVLLRAPVRAVEQSKSGVSVHTEGREFRARRAIIAIPLPVLRHVHFEPALPARVQATSELGFGRSSSVVIVTRGLSRWDTPGAAVGDAPVGLAWRRGRTIKGLVPPGSMERAGASLARTFGVSEHRRVEHSVDWTADPQSGGTYLAPAPGELSTHGAALGLEHGRIYFAGSERSSWPDSMEGALESGERAAADLLSVGR